MTRLLRMLVMVLGALAAVALVLYVFLSDLSITGSFTSLTLSGVPELETDDETFRVELESFTIHGQPGRQLKLLGTTKSCPDVLITPATHEGNAALVLSPRGAGCSVVAEWMNADGKLVEQTLMEGAELPIVPRAGEGRALLLGPTHARQIKGHVEGRVKLRDQEPICTGDDLDLISLRNLRAEKVEWLPSGSLEVALSLGMPLRFDLDGQSCLLTSFLSALRGVVLDNLDLLLGALAAVLGGVLGVRRFAKRRSKRTTHAAVLALLATCASLPATARAQAVAPRRVLIVGAFNDCTTLALDAGLKRRVEAAITALATQLRAQPGLDVAEPMLQPTERALLAALAAERGPLWLVLAGHGAIASRASVICLRDRASSIERIVAALPAGATSSIWVDACSSASVDIQREGASVVSASPIPVASTQQGTPLIGALVEALQKSSTTLDASCDGVVTERELFESMRIRAPAVGEGALRPKLRPARSDIPLFASMSLACARPPSLDALAERHPQLRTLIARERDYRAGRAPAAGELPPVLFATTAPLPPGIVAPEYLVQVGSIAEAESLARSFVLPRVVRVATQESSLGVLDVRVDGEGLVLERSIPAAGLRLAELEPAIVLPRRSTDPAPDGERERYRTAPAPDARRELTAGDLKACGCTSPTGHCFCPEKPIARKR